MFADEFFPTPPDLAARLVAPYLGKVTSVLDPSAGDGALLKPFFEDNIKLYAIEIAPELRAILHGYKQQYADVSCIRVLGEDVFKYEGRHVFDLVLVNPPFSEWEAHLHAAAQLVSPGGSFAAIIPDDRWGKNSLKAVQLLRDAGLGDFDGESRGSAFADAARKTNVTVAILRATRPAAAQTVDFSTGWKAGTVPAQALPDLSNQLAKGRLCRHYGAGIRPRNDSIAGSACRLVEG